KHPGTLGKTFSFLKIDNSRIRVLALKKAERGDEIILRMVETDGKAEENVHIKFAAPLAGFAESTGQENHNRPGTDVQRGEIITSFSPYQLRTFALNLAAPAQKLALFKSEPVKLDYDVSVATPEGKPAEGCFDCILSDPTAPQGRALPAEMLP